MMNPEIERARGQFLSATYGKFDFIASIIPKELLQIGKPRLLKQWMIEHLGIPTEKINYNTLSSWFFRYRRLKGFTKKVPENMSNWNNLNSFDVREQRTDPGSERFILKKVTTK